jgi:hypothetical protein
MTHHQQAFIVDDPAFSINVFAASVVGGLGSLLGAFAGALWWNGTFFWLKGAWRLFASGIGVLIVLLVATGGLAGLWYDLRDATLRKLGRRYGVVEEDLAEDLLVADDGEGTVERALDEAIDTMIEHATDDDEVGDPASVPAPSNGADPPAASSPAAADQADHPTETVRSR